jgi:transcriptional regulator with XRE-family HTH domain
MNVLDKIVKLREERGWSEYRLAEEAGLTQSTISTWYRKNMIPTIPSLERICSAFNISISQFFLDDTDNTITLNSQQKRLLEYSIRLNPDQFEALIKFLETL